MNALFYLEWRQWLNHVRKIARQPARSIVYVVIVGYFIFAAVMRARAPAHFPHAAFSEPYASAVFFGYVALLGILGYGAACGLVSGFYSGADARFLNASHIPERTIVMWLQLRRSGSAIGRTVFTAVLYAIVLARSGAAGGIAFTIVGAAFAASAIAVPILKVRSKYGAAAAQSICAAVIICGLLPAAVLLAALVRHSFETPARAIEGLRGGVFLNALLGADTAALAALFGVAAFIVALAFWCGTDLLPELYASSLRMLEYRSRTRRSGAGFTVQYSFGSSGHSAKPPRFGGPWTIAWKEWIAFTRSASMQRVFFLTFAGCAAGGAFLGTLLVRSRDPMMVWLTFGGVAAPFTLILLAVGSAVGLAADLAKPLWWIGPDPLPTRLFAWIAGTSWRFALCLGAGIIAAGLCARAPMLAAAGLPLAACAVVQLRSVGLALYALFPAAIDQRGPLALVRAMLTYFLAVPPLAAALVSALAAHSAALGIVVGAGVSLTESGLLVAGAAALIAGRGVAFARAESS